MTDQTTCQGLPARLGNLPRTVDNLCAAWNDYTAPYVLRSAHEHHRCAQAERAINRLMQRDGIRYRELSNGMRIPA